MFNRMLNFNYSNCLLLFISQMVFVREKKLVQKAVC